MSIKRTQSTAAASETCTDVADFAITSLIRKHQQFSGLLTNSAVDIHPDVYRPVVFDDVDSEYGVPAIAKQFLDFQLGVDVLPFWNNDAAANGGARDCITVENIKMRYVYGYLKHSNFTNVALLKTTRYDHIVYGIIAYIFQWPTDVILRFGKEFRDISTLVDWLAIDKKNLRLIAYHGYPVTPRIFRILSWHFEHDLHLITNPSSSDPSARADSPCAQPYFTISKYISHAWIMHFQYVYDKILKENWSDHETSTDAFFEQTRRNLGTPFVRFAPVNVPRVDRPKYITGVACCGKTTVLKHLQRSGWRFESRDSMGTFSGKSKTPALVASLHAAIDDTLRTGAHTVIGDRGPIDNPLWTAIMQLCDPQHRTSVVYKLVQFFEATFNEPVIRYHSGFDVVVFLDQYPSRNRERMLSRNDGGDAHRARLRQYVPVQFMAYYMFACLFGFRMIFVPYDRATGKFDGAAHTKNAELVGKHYGCAATIIDSRSESTSATKLNIDLPEFMADNTFPIVYGIFK